MKKLFAWVLLALAVPATAWSTPPSYVGAQGRYWVFSNHNDLRDVLAYWMQGYFHVQLEHWDFLDRDTEDRWRPEIGVHLRDYRKSVYTVQWRGEQRQDRFWLGTDQVLSDHVVGRAEISPIVSRDSTLWVFSGGADYYWGSYNFASVTVIHDPRGQGGEDLWVVPMRVRLANEQDDWVQATFAPASSRTVGWALDVKKRWVRLGVERNNRYDFTNLDNTVFTAGFEIPLNKKKE